MQLHLKWSYRSLITYTIYFFIIALFIFMPYYLTDTSLVWQSDGIAQHVPALVHWQNDLKDIIHNHYLPTSWQWQLGLGADYYQTFSYYTLGDIFSYGVAFISKSHLLNYYNFMIIVRLYLAGVAFLVAAHHWFKKRPIWQYQLAAFSYVFSGYTAFAVFEHPFFINPLIIFPLLILAMDYALSKQNYIFLIVMIFWTLWNNFYFAFMMVIGLGIFWVGYQFYHHTWTKWTTHFKVLLASIIGSLLASPLFIPSVNAVFSSARSNNELANGLTLYPLYYYFALPGNLIANLTTPSFWLTGGFSALSVMAIIFSLRRWHQYRYFNYLWIICSIGVCLPAFAAILNGGSSPSNRWLFLILLPASFILLQMLNDLANLSKRDYLYFFIVGLIASFSLLIISNFNLNNRYGVMIAIYFVTIIVLWLTQSTPHFKPIWLVVLVLSNIFLLTIRNHTNNTNPDTTDSLSNQVVQTLIKQQHQYLKPQTKALTRAYVDNQLNNATGIAPATNLPIIGPLNNIESYWSLQNGAVGSGLAKLAINTANPNDITGNLDSRDVLSNVLGVSDRYENPNSLTPYSYQVVANQVVNGQSLVHSKNAYPLLYFPKYKISQTDYDKLSPTTKEASLADSIVVKNSRTKQHSQFAKSVKTAPIRTNLTKSPTKKLHMTYKTNSDWLPAGFYLSPSKDLAGTELHLELSNIHFHPYNIKQQQQIALTKYRYDHQQNGQNEQNLIDRRYNEKAFTWNWYKHHFSSIGKEITGYTLTATYNDITNTFTQTGQSNLSFYNPQKQVTLNLGQANDTTKETFIPLTFSKVGEYSFDVQVKAIPTDYRFNKVAKTIQKTAPKYTLTNNQLSTTIKVKKASILATTIPYSKGWTAVDHSSRLVALGTGFIGIPLKAGTNHIVLRYQTPGHQIAKYGFLIGTVLLVIILCQRLIRFIYNHKTD